MSTNYLGANVHGLASPAAAVPVDALPPLTNAEIHTLHRLIECAEKLDERPRPMCRDCADEDGTCPNSGLECDMRALFDAAKALHNKLARAAVEADRAQRPEPPPLLTENQILGLLVPFGHFAQDDQTGRKTIAFARAVEKAVRAADRAQQGVPVANIDIDSDPDDNAAFCRWREDSGVDLGDKWVAWSAWCGAMNFRAATKAAAPADATQQQEKVVRLAGAPAGQLDAEVSALHGAILDLMGKYTRSSFAKQTDLAHYNEGFEDARDAAADLVSELASRRRAQGGNTSTESNSDRAPVSGTPTSGAVEGWKLVPLEPTEAMVHAAEDLPAPRMFGKVWRAMIAAAPSHPSEAKAGGDA